MPETLYHYTNVESLALILKNKSIKFNPLVKMDDTQEQYSADSQNFGKVCFVSSWTQKKEEDIPMWRMYCPKESGVRISLPINPFVLYNDYEYALKHGLPNLKLKEGGNPYTIISFQEMFKQDFFVADIDGRYLVTQVKYNNSHENLYPKILHKNGMKMSVDIEKLGAYKSKYWSFQEEWRYRLFPLPISVKYLQQPHLVANILYEKIEKNILNLPFESLFLKIREDCFDKMEIVMSPNISTGYQCILESLIEKYNPLASLKESELKGLIQ